MDISFVFIFVFLLSYLLTVLRATSDSPRGHFSKSLKKYYYFSDFIILP